MSTLTNDQMEFAQLREKLLDETQLRAYKYKETWQCSFDPAELLPKPGGTIRLHEPDPTKRTKGGYIAEFKASENKVAKQVWLQQQRALCENFHTSKHGFIESARKNGKSQLMKELQEELANKPDPIIRPSRDTSIFPLIKEAISITPADESTGITFREGQPRGFFVDGTKVTKEQYDAHLEMIQADAPDEPAYIGFDLAAQPRRSAAETLALTLTRRPADLSHLMGCRQQRSYK